MSDVKQVQGMFVPTVEQRNVWIRALLEFQRQKEAKALAEQRARAAFGDGAGADALPADVMLPQGGVK